MTFQVLGSAVVDIYYRGHSLYRREKGRANQEGLIFRVCLGMGFVISLKSGNGIKTTCL